MDPDSYLCRLADLFDGVTVTAPTIGAIIAILLAVLLLYASGFVSASEIAFFSLSPVDLSEIEEGKHTSDRRISALLNDSERLLATILISNNFVNVTIIMLCNYFFASTIHFGNSVILEFLLITVVLTFLLLLFGEIMPKIYSAQNTLKFCRKAAPAISFLKKFFSPLSALLVRSSFLVNRCVAKRNYNISVDELSQALELTDKKIRDLVGNAAGIAAEDREGKISLVSAPFYKANTEEASAKANAMDTKTLLILAGIAAAVLLILIIIILIVAKRRKKKRMLEEQELLAAETEVMPDLYADSDEDIERLSKEMQELRNDRGMELKKQVREFADQNPEISAQLLKSWLNGGEDHGEQ